MTIRTTTICLASLSLVGGAFAQGTVDETATRQYQIRQERLNSIDGASQSSNAARLEEMKRRRIIDRQQRETRQPSNTRQSQPVRSGNSRDSVVQTQ